MNGAYVEQFDCTFPAGDYSCFKVRATRSAACAALTTTPQAGMPCDIPECDTCSNATGEVLFSSGAPTIGYCLCAPASADGERKWSCASNAPAWPCPGREGCE